VYLPKHFSQANFEKVKSLIEENSFATILSFPEGAKTFINHLPVIFNSKSTDDIMIGHMSKRNRQWLHFKNNPDCTMIFQGGHTYITPKWYRSGRDVPTWNYAIVHLHGKIEVVETYNEQIEILKKLTLHYEKDNLEPWEFSMPEDLAQESVLTASIVSFRFKIENIEAKFKLSQNRSKDDQQGIIEGLKKRTDEMSKLVLRMMQE
jgi:transcriptional regulator